MKRVCGVERVEKKEFEGPSSKERVETRNSEIGSPVLMWLVVPCQRSRAGRLPHRRQIDTPATGREGSGGSSTARPYIMVVVQIAGADVRSGVDGTVVSVLKNPTGCRSLVTPLYFRTN